MDSFTKEKIAILRQVDPNIFARSDQAIVIWLINEELRRLEYEPPIHFFDADLHDYDTLAYCERAYEEGYDAVINDGKIIAFKKAV